MKIISSLELQNILKFIMFWAVTLLYVLKIALLHVLVVVKMAVHLKKKLLLGAYIFC